MKNETTEKIFASRPFSGGMCSSLQIFQVVDRKYKTKIITSLNRQYRKNYSVIMKSLNQTEAEY